MSMAKICGPSQEISGLLLLMLRNREGRSGREGRDELTVPSSGRASAVARSE